MSNPTDYNFVNNSIMGSQIQRLGTFMKVEPKSDPLIEDCIPAKESYLMFEHNYVKNFNGEPSDQEKLSIKFNSKGYVVSINNKKIKEEIIGDVEYREQEELTSFEPFVSNTESLLNNQFTQLDEVLGEHKFKFDFTENCLKYDGFDKDILDEGKYSEVEYVESDIPEKLLLEGNDQEDLLASSIFGANLHTNGINNLESYTGDRDKTLAPQAPSKINGKTICIKLLNIHQKTKDINRFQCSQCPYRTKRKFCLNAHMKTHMKPEDVYMFQCNKCSYKTKQKGNLKTHMITHMIPGNNGNTTYKCAQCSYKVKNKRYLNVHMKTHLKPEDNAMFKCNQCSYLTKRKRFLTEHMKVHMNPGNIQLFRCDQCPYKTIQKGNLTRHMNTHMNSDSFDTMYQCGQCSYKAKSKFFVTLHMKTHMKCSDNEANDNAGIKQYNLVENFTEKQDYRLENQDLIEPKTEPLDETVLIPVSKEFVTQMNVDVNAVKIEYNFNDFNRQTDFKDEFCVKLEGKDLSFTSHSNKTVESEKPEEYESSDTIYNTYMDPLVLPKSEPPDEDIFNPAFNALEDDMECLKFKSEDIAALNKTFDNESEEKEFTENGYLLQNFDDNVNLLFNTQISGDTVSHKRSRKCIYKFHCNLCSFKAKQKRSFKTHMKIHLSPEDRDKYRCSQCPYRTKLKYCLNSHLKIHMKPGEINMFQCSHCSYQGKRKGDLTQHSIIHMKPEEIDMFHCSHCSYKAKQKNNLISHMKNHMKPEKIDMFQCNYCSYSAKHRSGMKYHISKNHMISENPNTFQCDKCSYSTKYKSSLKTHKIMHMKPEEIDMIQCSQCSYQGKRKGDLTQHLKTHMDPEDVKMAQCSHCSYKAKHKSVLRYHVLKNHAKS